MSKVNVLLGDIGGTNARLKLVKMTAEAKGHAEEVGANVLKPFESPSLEKLLEKFLEPYKGKENYPVYAVIGIAAPVFNNVVEKTTNVPHWGKADGNEIGNHLNIKKLVFLNDFVINGYAIQDASLEEGKDFSYVNKKPMNPNGLKAMIGPGTGVGMGILIKEKNSNYHQVIPSEGSHQDFAPKNEQEFNYFKFLKKVYKIDHVSMERAACGVSLVPMYKFLCEYEKNVPEKTLKEKVDKLTDMNSNDEERVKINRNIFHNGLHNECKVCRRVLEFFVELIANAAGNLALCTLCTGGLYLLGGISITLEKIITGEPIFMKHFVDKGRLGKILPDIPVLLIKDGDFGMRGAKEYARRIIEGTC